MKKIYVMLSLFVMFTFLSLPKIVNATTFVESGGKYVSTSNEPVGKYGTFKAGDITYKYTDTANGIKEWEYWLTAGSDMEYIYISLEPNSLEILEIDDGNSVIIEDQTKTSSGVNVLIATSGIKSGERVLLFTVTTKDTAETGCSLSYQPLELNCLNVGSSYFDEKGNYISKTDYEKNPACSNYVEDDKPEDVPNNSETGSVVPYIAIGGGLLAIAIVYFISKKSNKMYKI